MRFSVLLSAAAAVGVGGFVSNSFGRDFVSSVTSYAEGTFATVGGAHFTQTSSAVGKPYPIVDEGSAFSGILSPFNAHFENDQVVAFGLGGHITLQFPQAVGVSGTPQVGLFTAASLNDASWPNGQAGSTAMTTALLEYGAERTAIVEVAKTPGDFRSLGRIVFDDPSNYYANATSPYQFPAPTPAVEANYEQPFAGSPDDFNNRDFAGVLKVLNGSAGGTWITVPLALGLDSIQYVRISDPKWQMPDGSLVDMRPSVYFPPPNEFIKPADIFLDGAVLIPEPASALSLLGLVFFVTRATSPCRRRSATKASRQHHALSTGW